MKLFVFSLLLCTSSCELFQPRTELFVDQCEELEDGEERCLLITADGDVINAPSSILPPGTQEGDRLSAVIVGINP